MNHSPLSRFKNKVQVQQSVTKELVACRSPARHRLGQGGEPLTQKQRCHWEKGLDRFPKVRSFIAEREFLEGKAREGSWSGPMTAQQRCHREILSGI